MAWETPKPDPAAVERQRLAAEERIKTLQEDLGDITAARVRKFGRTSMTKPLEPAGVMPS